MDGAGATAGAASGRVRAAADRAGPPREDTVRPVTDGLDRTSRIVESPLLLAKAERPGFVSPEPVRLGEPTADVFVKALAKGHRGGRVGLRPTRAAPPRR